MNILEEFLLIKSIRGQRIRPAKAQAWVDKRGKAGLCCVPGCSRSYDEPGGGCGQCAKHYQRVKRTTINQPISVVWEIHRGLEKKGERMQPHECRRYRDERKAS